MHSVIIQAISERRRLKIVYPPGSRVVEPCAYGSSSEGFGLLRAYQNSGASASGEHEWWKLFRIDRIMAIELLPEVFDGLRPEYRRNDKAMKRQIFCQL